MRILAISGSLREASHNTALLRAAAELLPPGAEVEVFDGLGDVPHYNQDIDGEQAPEAVTRLRDAIAGADAVLFATPEYNGSVPGVLKNAVDWASRPARNGVLWGKTAAVIGASTGAYGALWAQTDLRKELGVAGARVLGTDFPVARAHEQFGPDGELLDATLAERLENHLRELVELAVPEPVAA
ncbi:MAG: NADPH-dependent FMN reductase [Gaiellales bacterium]